MSIQTSFGTGIEHEIIWLEISPTIRDAKFNNDYTLFNVFF